MKKRLITGFNSDYTAEVREDNTLRIKRSDWGRGPIVCIAYMLSKGKKYVAFPEVKSGKIDLENLEMRIEEEKITLDHPKYGTHVFGSGSF